LIRLSEEARYEVLRGQGAFELRQYDDLVIATTTVGGKFREASEEGFKRLAGYIFGHNHSHENFPMTVPVLQQPESRKISMTAPVLQSQEPGGWTMSFVLPKDEKFSAAPHPDDDRVKLRPVTSQCWAVLRYNGRTDEKEMRLKERELREWILEDGALKATDEIRWAQYDSPLTIPFLRRNEVQIRVETATRFQ
jgi:hypothetical protein